MKTLSDKIIDAVKSGVEKGVKGGPGSGNFGHAGRPGQEGGSASGDSPAVLDAGDDRLRQRFSQRFADTTQPSSKREALMHDIKELFEGKNLDMNDGRTKFNIDVMKTVKYVANKMKAIGFKHDSGDGEYDWTGTHGKWFASVGKIFPRGGANLHLQYDKWS